MAAFRRVEEAERGQFGCCLGRWIEWLRRRDTHFALASPQWHYGPVRAQPSTRSSRRPIPMPMGLTADQGPAPTPDPSSTPAVTAQRCPDAMVNAFHRAAVHRRPP